MNPVVTSLANAEDPTYKSRSVHLKFMQQLFLGLGGAVLFGVVGAVALHGAALGLATFGLAALGVGCLYLGSKYLAENIMLDQENQARKIGLMNQLTQTPTQDMNLTVAKSTPPGMGAQLADEAAVADNTAAATPVWTDRVERAEKIDPAMIASKASDAAWGDKVKTTTGTAIGPQF